MDTVLEARPELAAVVRYLNLPPREGPIGQTGFGLKIPMFINSLAANGLTVESASYPEPFTFPTQTGELTNAEIEELGNRVMDLKARWLARVSDPYDRPARARAMSVELGKMMPHVSWPIVRVVGRRL